MHHSRQIHSTVPTGRLQLVFIFLRKRSKVKFGLWFLAMVDMSTETTFVDLQGSNRPNGNNPTCAGSVASGELRAGLSSFIHSPQVFDADVQAPGSLSCRPQQTTCRGSMRTSRKGSYGSDECDGHSVYLQIPRNATEFSRQTRQFRPETPSYHDDNVGRSETASRNGNNQEMKMKIVKTR